MERRDGKIYFEGVAAETLAEACGTPLYVYEANRIRENYRRLDKAFRSRWPRFQIYYAVKANSNPAVIRLLMEEGAFCDCASANEIQLAQKLGARGEQILFSGNYLREEDLEEGARSGCLVNLDDASLLPRLLRYGRPQTISFRINPGIGKSNVHESDVMAGKEAKFGIALEKAEEAYAQAKAAGVGSFGVHMMCGSCVTDPAYFETITQKLLDGIGPVALRLGIRFDWIDIGGGFGIPYAPGEEPLNIEKTARLVTDVLAAKTSEYKLGEPKLVVEPGRYLVGDAGYVLGRVHAIKEGYKKFVGTDVGMNIMARPVLYGAYHGIVVEQKKSAAEKELVTICGQACENADAWARDRELPKLNVGDLITVENAGAYGYAMSYPYNGRLRAAEVLVDQTRHRLVRRRETFDDWIALTNV